MKLDHLIEDSVSSHGLFVGFAIRLVLEAFPKSQLMCRDDYTGNRLFDEAAICPNIHGYRPDAIIQSGQDTLLLEVKSFPDLLSDRSIAQYRKISEILRSSPSFLFVLFCFGCEEKKFESLKSEMPFDISLRDRIHLLATKETI